VPYALGDYSMKSLCQNPKVKPAFVSRNVIGSGMHLLARVWHNSISIAFVFLEYVQAIREEKLYSGPNLVI